MGKYILILIAAFTVLTTSNKAQWVEQTTPTLALLTRCIFTDTLNGWAAGDSGVIIHTSDGGQNWYRQNSGIAHYNYINDITFVNSRLGWSVSNDYFLNRNYLIKTTNGGTNWSAELYNDSTIFLNTVYFIDSANGYMGAMDGKILKTTNAGISWNRMWVDSSIQSNFPVMKFNFYNYQYGVACGGIINYAGVVWKTTNSGLNWNAEIVGPSALRDIRYIDPNRIISTGGDFSYGAYVVRSSNGGTSWNYQALNIFGIGYSIAFRTPSEIWVSLGFAQNWAVSQDTGKTWMQKAATLNSSIYDTKFVTPNRGWAVGEGGRVFKYNGQLSGGTITGNETPVQFRLYQNYPNPFNPTTKIRFTILLSRGVGTEGERGVLLVVYDLLGREITKLVNEQLNPGTYEIEWNAANYPSGVYFYKLIAGDFTETKKMILAK